MLLIQEKKAYITITSNDIFVTLDPTYMHFMVRRLAAVNKRRCYIEVFRLIIEHKVAYTVYLNGVFFNLSSLPDELVLLIDDTLNHNRSPR